MPKSREEIRDELRRRRLRARSKTPTKMSPQPSPDTRDRAAAVREEEMNVLAAQGRAKLLAKQQALEGTNPGPRFEMDAEGRLVRNDYGRGPLRMPAPSYPSRTKAELKGGQGAGTIGRLVEMFVEQPLEDAIWAIENPIDRLAGRGRAANGQMMWPGGGRVPRFKPGSLEPADDLAHLAEGTYPKRTVRYGESETQFPASQSRITRQAQRAADAISERLAPKVDALRESDSALARATGKALTLPSARRRVPVQAGKQVAQEGRRRKAGAAESIRSIRDLGSRVLPGRKLEGDQAAHFWYAQLPKSYRNAEGLTLVRGRLAEEHERLVSGDFGRSVQAAINELRGEAKAARLADDTDEAFRVVNAIQQLRRIEADIPERIADVQENLLKLDKLIAKPPVVNEKVLAGLEYLSRETQDIYIRAGKLDPDIADERAGLVSRWAGLEPTGEEIFVGHRQGKVKGSRPSAMPGGISTGKTKVPAGIVKKNRLVLLKSGRVRQDLESAVEDWQAAQAYEFTNRAKDELASMGEPVVGRPKPGHVLINPRGHELPRTWKTDDQALARAEGFDPDDVLVSDLEEYIGNVMAQTPGQAEKLLKAATEAGHLKDLRQVPADVVNRYYEQFQPASITVATPGIKQGVSMLSKGGNLANDTLYLSLIYSNIGYIPSQIVANTGMAVAHQGALFPVNFSRATQVLTTGPRRIRDLLNAEHGQGATAAAPQTRAIQKITRPIAAVADDAFRVSSVLHEAARLKVIPKTSPVLTKRDYAALEEFLTNPAYRGALNDASDRATQAMVDFNRIGVGTKEAALAKPAGFVWRWIRGGSRYPIRFAADHPIRTAGIAGGAYLAQDEIRDATADDLPPWLEGSLNAGDTVVDGETYPRILPTRSFSPISTPLETIRTLTGQQDARTFGEMVNPLVPAALNIASRKNAYGGKEDSYLDALLSNVDRLAPTPRFVGEVINPSDEPGLYPEDQTWLGRIKRQSRLVPFAINPDEMDDLADLSPRESVENKTEKLIEQSRAVGLPEPPREVLRGIAREAALQEATARGLTYAQRLEIAAKVLQDETGDDRFVDYKLRGSEAAQERQAEKAYLHVRKVLLRHLHRWERRLDRKLDAQLEEE